MTADEVTKWYADFSARWPMTHEWFSKQSDETKAIWREAIGLLELDDALAANVKLYSQPDIGSWQSIPATIARLAQEIREARRVRQDRARLRKEAQRRTNKTDADYTRHFDSGMRDCHEKLLRHRKDYREKHGEDLSPEDNMLFVVENLE